MIETIYHGSQNVIHTPEFSRERLKYTKHHKASVAQYYTTATARDDDARRAYRNLKEKTKGTLLFRYDWKRLR